MAAAIEQARLCPPSATAYSVGAVIVDAQRTEISRGHSRENDPRDHAEESALAKLPAGDPRLRGATVYSTLEPCARRKSRERTCAQLILAAGVNRVVIAWLEPRLFVPDPQGREILEAGGVTVTEMPEFAPLAREPNRHLAIQELPPADHPVSATGDSFIRARGLDRARGFTRRAASRNREISASFASRTGVMTFIAAWTAISRSAATP